MDLLHWAGLGSLLLAMAVSAWASSHQGARRA